MFRRSALFALLVLFFLQFVAAQDHPLPHQLTEVERTLIPHYRDSRANGDRSTTTTPPSFPVRTMAEWEEIQSLVICWAQYEGILKQIVAAAKTECEVIIVCSDQTAVTATLMDNTYGGPLPDLDNITFIEAPYNSVWMRDYGAECMYQNEVDSLFLMDWIYNRPRPEDDVLPDVIGQTKNIAVFSSSQAPYDMVHTGGNFMADGFGTAFSSNLVIDENGAGGQFNQTVRTPEGVDALIDQWMGIDHYIRMQTLPNDGIHHIDMHMKLIDEETLLVGEFPQGLSDGPQLETNLDVIEANETNTFGQPFRIVRVPMPSSTGGQYPPSASYRTYANNVFVNRTVIVPTYRTEFDTIGLRVLHESLPGYRIVPIDCDNTGMNIISASGAIHCITKGIGVADPLLIKHQRLTDTYDTQNPYAATAYIRHRSGIASATLYWTTDTTQAWTAAPMADQGTDNWSTAIPAQIANTTVYYYIEATSNSGKTMTRPIVAPHGWWSFRVLDITSAIGHADAPSIVDVFPNPCNSVVLIHLDRLGEAQARIAVFDPLGREIVVLHDGVIAPDGRIYLDVSALSNGTYALEITTSGGRATRTLIKQ